VPVMFRILCISKAKGLVQWLNVTLTPNGIKECSNGVKHLYITPSFDKCSHVREPLQQNFSLRFMCISV
jgi:hypothetical protein